MKTMLAMTVLAAVVLAAAAPVEACSAGGVIETATSLVGTPTYDAARSVAGSVLDEEGIARDIEGKPKTGHADVTTTWEIATGTLLFERQERSIAAGDATVDALRAEMQSMLGETSNKHGGIVGTVRGHMLYHVDGVLVDATGTVAKGKKVDSPATRPPYGRINPEQAQASRGVSPAARANGNSAPTPTVESPVTAASAAPEPESEPSVDHAG